MHRTNIYLTDEEHRLLTARAREEGTTMAQVVRDLIDAGLGIATKTPSLAEAVAMSAGVWRDRTEQELEDMPAFRGFDRRRSA